MGSGVAGISAAYELVTRGKKVTMIEARNVISGESGRTSGHLSNALDDGYINIEKKHGFDHAKMAAGSHTWAINRVADNCQKLGVGCEFRYLPAYRVSQYSRGDHRHEEEVATLKAETELAANLGIDAFFRDGLAVRGWDGKPDQRDAAVFSRQTMFHSTKYLLGVLNWLRNQPKFQCFTYTRAVSIQNTPARVHTQDGHVIVAGDVIEATCVPLQKLSIITEMEYMQTYCIAVRIPKGSVEDCLIYNTADPYRYVRLTTCDEKDDYLVVGGSDHKVGQSTTAGRFNELETWTHYRWSGQIFEPVDFVGFVGKNQDNNHTYVVTGDSGNGLTNGVLAGKLIADEIEGKPNPWMSLYSPNRLVSIAKSLPSMIEHDAQINMQYKRYLESDVRDIEEIPRCHGGVLNTILNTKPTAVYRDKEGNLRQFSAVCPHMKGVVCWNNTEKSWDCPVHGSRFSHDGICIEGPAKSNLHPIDDFAREVLEGQQGH